MQNKYPRGWKKISRRIRELAGGRCEWCQRPCKLTKLTTHHLGAPYANGIPGNKCDKHEIRRENLIALCKPCHTDADNQKTSNGSEK